jgi:hypothetical protein
MLSVGALLLWLTPTQAQVTELPTQSSALDRALAEAMAYCNAKAADGEFRTRVDAAICTNDGVTKAFQSFHFPYMDLIFQFELAWLQINAKADRGEMSDEDVKAASQSAFLQLQAQVAQRDAAAAQQRAQIQAQAERESAAQAAAAEQARRNALMQFLLSKPFQPQPIQPYIMPTRPTTNCTSNVLGNTVYTNCQ